MQSGCDEGGAVATAPASRVPRNMPNWSGCISICRMYLLSFALESFLLCTMDTMAASTPTAILWRVSPCLSVGLDHDSVVG